MGKEVNPGTQAAVLGVLSGWKVVTLNDEPVSTTQELVSNIQELKADGNANAVIVFSTGGAQPPVQSSTVAPAESQPAEPDAPAAGNLKLSLDLSQPLGIFFDEACRV